MKTKILAFAGSLRRDSWNKKIVRIAAQGATTAGADVTFLDLRDLPMPLFDEDLERAEGHSATVKQFKQLLKDHHGFVIASPEYNSSISAALKNAIDWASRAEPGEPALVCFQGKVAGLVSASPGLLGGLRGLVTVRSILGNIGVIVVPEQSTVSKVHEAFGEDGKLKDAKQIAALERVGSRVANVASALAAHTPRP